MKNIIFFITIIFPIVAFSQAKSIKNESFDQTRPDPLGYYNTWHGTRQFYYDNDDNKILHGILKIDDKFSGTKSNISINETYRVNANYTDGKINGPFNLFFDVSRNVSGKKINTKWSVLGTYKNNVGDGEWKVILSGTANGQTYSEEHFTKFCDGELVKYEFSEIANNKKITHLNFKIEEGYLSGIVTLYTYGDQSIGKYDIKTNIICNEFIRLTGHTSETDVTERTIIASLSDSILKGTYPKDWLLQQGYVLKEKDYAYPLCDKLYKLLYYTDNINLSYFDNNALQLSYKPALFQLKKVRLATYEQLVSWAENYEDSYDAYYNHNQYKNKEELSSKKYIFIEDALQKTDHVKIEPKNTDDASREYYITSTIKNQFLEYIHPLVESQREALIALEKAKKEAALMEKKMSINKEVIAEMGTKPIEFAKAGDCLAVRITDYSIKEETYVSEITGEYDIMNKIPWGYYTYKFTIPTNSISRSAINAKSTKIQNTWDTIIKEAINIQKLDTLIRQDLANKIFAEEKQAYENFIGSVSFSKIIDNKDTQGSLTRIKRAHNEQQKYKEYLDNRNLFQSNDAALLANEDKSVKDIINSYKQFNTDNPVTMEYPEIDNSINKIKYKLAIQENIKTYISQRRTILSNHAQIIGNKNGKNVISIYNSYYKTIDTEWDGISAVDRAESFIEIQNKILEILKMPTINEFDLKVKQQKCKDIQSLLQMNK